MDEGTGEEGVELEGELLMLLEVPVQVFDQACVDDRGEGELVRKRYLQRSTGGRVRKLFNAHIFVGFFVPRLEVPQERATFR